MLTLFTGRGERDCQGISRRDFLTIGSLGLGGLTLASLLQAKAFAADQASDFVHDKAVVMIFLGGGPSHIETFNPNMGAVEPYRSVSGEVKTSLPGVTLGGTFPALAKHADKLALIRSFCHPIGGHVQAIHHILSGGTDVSGSGNQGQSMGSVFSRLRGSNHPQSGMPTYALVTAPETDRQYRSELGRITRASQPGSLGSAFSPFNPSGSGTALENMSLSISTARLEDRQALLKQLDRLKRKIDSSGLMEGYDKFTQQAVDLVTGGATKAFDLSNEDPRIIERYDTSMFRVGNKLLRPQSVRPATVGRQMLLTRRLIEAGCGFITVQNAGWDMHADGNNPGIHDGIEMLGRPLDKALSAFLEDLENRGLSEKVLVVLTGDFGRTPKINRRGGRDHWANLCTLALMGGGLNMGQVIGQSSQNNDRPATDPISPANLMATVMHTLFDVGKVRLQTQFPPQLRQLLDAHQPIEQLF